MTGGKNIGLDMEVITAGIKRLQRAIESAGNSDLARMHENVTAYEVGGTRNGSIEALHGFLERMRADLANRGVDASALGGNVTANIMRLQAAAADLQNIDASAAQSAQSLAGQIAEATGVSVPAGAPTGQAPAPSEPQREPGEQRERAQNKYSTDV